MESEKSFVDGLVAVLVADKVVSKEEAQVMVREFGNRSQVSFDYFLISEGLVEKDDLLAALSKYYQVPAVDVRGFFFDAGLVQKFPKDFLLHLGVIPLEVDQNIMTVVTNNPNMPGLESKLEESSSYVIEFRVGLLRDIIDMVREYYNEEIVTTGEKNEDDTEELTEEDDINQIPE
jgi:hypothetical protein